MPIGPTIAVLGAGSLRAGAPVLATLIALPLNPGSRLYLQDRDPEMLDLFDRLARALAAHCDFAFSILATTDAEEALSDAQAVVLCSDRHTRGLNRRKEAEVVAKEMALVAQAARDRELLIYNLVAPVDASSMLLDAVAFHLDWPPPLEPGREFAAAHQALRWVRADEPAFEPLTRYHPSPLTEAILDARPAPENRYRKDAIDEWLLLAKAN